MRTSERFSVPTGKDPIESVGPSLQKAVGRLDDLIRKAGDEAVRKVLSEKGGAKRQLRC